METKSLLIAISSFIAGALLVSIAAVTFEKPQPDQMDESNLMVDELKSLSGDAYDEKFISGMILHHEGAVEMAELSDERAKHEEIKKLSEEIIASQQKEIVKMKEWQEQWGYETGTPARMSH